MVETNRKMLVNHAFFHLFMKILLITLAQERILTRIGARLRLIPMEFAYTENGDIVLQIAQVKSNMVIKLIIKTFHIFKLFFISKRISFFLLISVDGKWSGWGGYGACSVTCGGGKQKRYRTCTNPRPVGIGKACPGTNMQSRDCNKATCPGKLSFLYLLFIRFFNLFNTRNL